jgi:hypothetical protein
MRALMKWARRADVACQAQQHLALFIFLIFFILINAFFKNNNNYYI